MAKKVAKLTVKEAAEFLGISVQAVRKYSGVDGPIPAVREGGRVLFDAKALAAFKKDTIKANKARRKENTKKHGRLSALETILA